jgi:hypothetical protein
LGVLTFLLLRILGGSLQRARFPNLLSRSIRTPGA